MRASSPRGRGNGKWRQLDLDLAKAGEMLRDLAHGREADPISAVVFRDRQGRHRRIVATYDGGWRLQVNFALNGSVSSYQLACTLKVVANSQVTG